MRSRWQWPAPFSRSPGVRVEGTICGMSMEPAATTSPSTPGTREWVCEACEWVYDEATGDPMTGVAPSTPFPAIQDSFECPSCGGPGSQFAPT